MRIAAALLLLAGCAWRVEPLRRRPDTGAPIPVETVGKGFLGLEGTAHESERLEDLEFFPGISVASVVPNSPAERAGLAAGDVLLTVDGAPVNGASALRAVEAAAEPGRTLRLEVKRGDRILEANLTVEARTGSATLGEIARVEEEKAGVRVRDRAVEEEGKRRLAVEVVSFTGGSPLEEAGLRPADLLLALDGRPIVSAAEFIARIREDCEPGAKVRIEAARGGERIAVRARLRGGRRTLTRLRLPPLFSYERDVRGERTRWWIGDLLLFSLVRRDRRGSETEIRILNLFGWTTGEGVLREGAE